MPPPSQIQIATSSLQRLMKEEKSYHQEAEQQKRRIAKAESGGGGDDEDENREYTLRQERKALEETNAVLPGLRDQITNAREKLESLLGPTVSEQDREKALEVLKQAIEVEQKAPNAV